MAIEHIMFYYKTNDMSLFFLTRYYGDWGFAQDNRKIAYSLSKGMSIREEGAAINDFERIDR